MFDQLNLSLALKALVAITVLVGVHQVFWANDPAYRQKNYRDFEEAPMSISRSGSPSSVESLENLISLDLKLKYPTILPPKTAVSEQILLTLTTKELSLISRTPMDLIWVVDTSGSMSGAKIILLKDTLKYMLNMLSPQDRLSIVRFSSDAQRLTHLKLVNDQNAQFFKNIIDSLDPAGETNIGSGISLAIDILWGRKYGDRVSSIFVLSDGQDNDINAEHNIRKLLPEKTVKGGYTIHTFGYGYDHDPNLMGKIAKMRDGSFYFIEKLGTADEAFADAIGGVATVVAENVVIFVQPLSSSLFSHVTIKKGFGGDFIWTKDREGQYETKINQLSSGKSKNYVLTIGLGSFIENQLGRGESKVAKAVVTYSLPGKSERISQEIELVVRVTKNEEEFLKQQPDKQVLLNYYRVRAGEAMQESNKFAEEGQYELARNTLIKLKDELKTSPVSGDAGIVGTIADLERFAEKMKPVVYQQDGRYDMSQNVASYVEEKSNPYLSNSEKGMHLTNTAQSMMILSSRKRREGTPYENEF